MLATGCILEPVKAHSTVASTSGSTNHADINNDQRGRWLHGNSVVKVVLANLRKAETLFASAPTPYRGAPTVAQ